MADLRAPMKGKGKAAPTSKATAAQFEFKRPSTKRRAQDPPRGTAKKARTATPSGGSSSAGLPAGFFDAGSAAPSRTSTNTASASSNSGPSPGRSAPKPPKPKMGLTNEERLAIIEQEKVLALQEAAASQAAPSPRQPREQHTEPSETQGRAGSKGKGKSKGSKAPVPAGFFDDPLQDAKVRNVKYVDKAQEEWDRFERALKKEDKVSEAIMEAGTEEAMKERALLEGFEQEAMMARLEVMKEKQREFRLKQEARAQDAPAHPPATAATSATARTATKEGGGDSDSDSDLDDMDEYGVMHWRTKAT